MDFIALCGLALCGFAGYTSAQCQPGLKPIMAVVIGEIGMILIKHGVH